MTVRVRKNDNRKGLNQEAVDDMLFMFWGVEDSGACKPIKISQCGPSNSGATNQSYVIRNNNIVR
jgi:hypothetical protein